MSAEFLNTDFEKVSYLEKILTSRATNGDVSDSEYQKLRYELLSNNNIASLLPSWLKPHKSLDLLWGHLDHILTEGNSYLKSFLLYSMS